MANVYKDGNGNVLLFNGGAINASDGTVVSDTTATAGDVLSGKDFYLANGTKTTGTIQTYSGSSAITSNGTLSTGGKYMPSDLDINVSSAPTYYENDVNFYDYDGSIIISYTAQQFLALSEMPANPTNHPRLVAEGWNWTLSDAKTYVTSYGKLNVGQTYHTVSGKTEYDIVLDDGTGLLVSMVNNKEKDWGDGTIDSLTTHTYSNYGAYTIKTQETNNGYPQANSINVIHQVFFREGATIEGQFTNGVYITAISISKNYDTSFGYLRGFTQTSIKHITIPVGETKLKQSTFSNMFTKSLETISLPRGILTIENSVFNNCPRLKSITIPNTVTSLGNSVFVSCSALKDIIIPSSVTSIGSSCFNGALSLNGIILPTSIASIGTSSFFSNDYMSLRVIYILATTPPSLSSSSLFKSDIVAIYVPYGTKSLYESDTNWSAYNGKFVELPA